MQASTRNTSSKGKSKSKAPAATTRGTKPQVKPVPASKSKLKVGKATAVSPAVTAPAVSVVTTREERNGVKRPRPGGKCAAVWDWLDAQIAAGKEPSVKDAVANAESQGWNTGNAQIEYYQWKKFNRPA